MDEIMNGIGQGIAHAGPEWVGMIGILAILAWLASQGMPFFAKYKMAMLDIERAREERKAEESRQREAHDRELAQMQGQWLEQYDRANKAQEQSNVVTEGVRAQMQVLNAAISESKHNSRQLTTTLNGAVGEIHDIHQAVMRSTGALTQQPPYVGDQGQYGPSRYKEDR